MGHQTQASTGMLHNVTGDNDEASLELMLPAVF
jgi:hypothetical protein